MICRNHVEVSEGVRRCARCMSPFCGDCLVEISGRPYCATCKQEQLLDVRSGIDRWDGSRPELASNWKRFGAWWLDNLLLGIPTWIIVFAMLPALMKGGQPSPFINMISFPLSFLSLFYEG